MRRAKGITFRFRIRGFRRVHRASIGYPQSSETSLARLGCGPREALIPSPAAPKASGAMAVSLVRQAKGITFRFRIRFRQRPSCTFPVRSRFRSDISRALGVRSEGGINPLASRSQELTGPPSFLLHTLSLALAVLALLLSRMLGIFLLLHGVLPSRLVQPRICLSLPALFRQLRVQKREEQGMDRREGRVRGE